MTLKDNSVTGFNRREFLQGAVAGVDPLLWPRLAGSWPGVTFPGAPLKLAAGQFG